MIKFPSTIAEYTDGKLWHGKIDESIARRILVDLYKLEDKEELDLRKMYLAHFYCEKGEYRLAMTLAKALLLEGKFVDDVVVLLKRICLKSKDIENFAYLIRLVDKLYRGNPPLSFFDSLADYELLMAIDTGKYTDKGEISYKEGNAEYYQDGKLVFTVKDKNYDAFLKYTQAKQLLSDGQIEEAIDILSDLELANIKLDIKLLHHQTLVQAYCLLNRFEDAFEYCKLLIDNKLFMPEMTDILYHLYADKSPKFEELKKFFVEYKGFGTMQLGDIHSLANELEDEEFWNEVYSNNPIDPSDVREETYLFKGILAFNNCDYDLAERYIKQATALYGLFGKSGLFRYFIDCYMAKLKKSPIIEDMPSRLYTARIDDIYDFIDKKLFPKLKRCVGKEDFLKHLDDNLLELDNMLSGASVKSSDIVSIVNKVYKMGYIPACQLIKRIVADVDYNSIVRAICLANYLLYDKPKKIIIGENIYENPFYKTLKVQLEQEDFAFIYGMAILLSLSMVEGIDAKSLKEESEILKKLYSNAQGDYSCVKPLAVFGLMLAFLSGDAVQYDKDVVKKREVKAFAEAYLDNCDVDNQSEDIFNFLMMCSGVLDN